ncbi:hypothetical protein LTR85_012071 [Meristemomyces frigidus]|nr:hypothetical protein LTR85_012071 [Meristemomyces frigidus]
MGMGHRWRVAFNVVEEDVADDSAFTVLHTAVVLHAPNGRLSPELLRHAFRDIDTPDRSGETPLHWACIKGDLVAVQLLLQFGANTNLKDSAGDTALHYASMSGSPDCVTAMLDAGAAADAVNADGTKAMYILAGADLRGLDPWQMDGDGDTPDNYFYQHRDARCAIIRPSFEEEETAWLALMSSVRRQNGFASEPHDGSRVDLRIESEVESQDGDEVYEDAAEVL